MGKDLGTFTVHCVKATGNAKDADFDSGTRQYCDVPIVIEGWFRLEEKR